MSTFQFPTLNGTINLSTTRTRSISEIRMLTHKISSKKLPVNTNYRILLTGSIFQLTGQHANPIGLDLLYILYLNPSTETNHKIRFRLLSETLDKLHIRRLNQSPLTAV